MAPPLHARIHGAGPTGSLAALALAASGWRVSLVDPRPAGTLRQLSRAYALNQSSWRLLEQLGLRAPLEPHLVPFRQLQLRDQASGAGLAFGSADLGPRPQACAGAVGWIVPHGALMAVLQDALEAEPAITSWLGQAPAGESPAGESPADGPHDLLVAADGAGSPTRSSRGLGWLERPYGQACLTLQVQLRGLPADGAWELFRPEGPFAVLPLGEGQAQVVWSAPAARCRQRAALPPAALLDALAAVLPAPLQPDALLDEPRAFPVALGLAGGLRRGRMVLVGESAHRCHPVGGQGLNLCWRDVAALQRLAGRCSAGRLPVRRLPAAYARRRWPDLLLTLLLTDTLVRLFSNRLPPLLPLRRLALAAMARVPLLRRLVLAAMTDGPCGAFRP